MGVVVGLSGLIGSRLSAPPGVQPGQRHGSFTPRDRADLAAWSRNGRRAVICSSESGVFAMLHEAGRSWASWGVVRQSRSILLWDCVTLADRDRLPTMIDALASLALDDELLPEENVLDFTRIGTAAS